MTLLAQLEAASVGSRELDCRIHYRLLISDGKASAADLEYVLTDIERIDPPPRYTSSVDCALSLVPEGCDWTVSNEEYMGRSHFADCAPKGVTLEGSSGNGAALAICIAALKAQTASAGLAPQAGVG